MADYWAKAEGEIAEHMNRIAKIVCSKTLRSADWNNTTIVRDAVAELSKYKEDGRGNMFVFGSGNLSESLMKADLFDEYRLCLAPVFLGSGGRLFSAGLNRQTLRLLESRQLSNDGVILRYTPVSN
jgi:dihydrofolate reductase